jgi:hypothetical protein
MEGTDGFKNVTVDAMREVGFDDFNAMHVASVAI